MHIEWVAIALYAMWLVTEAMILRPARDRSGANIDHRSLLILGSSNMLLPLLSIGAYLLGIGDAPFPLQLKILGIVLMLAGFATRWSGVWTLRKFFSANVAVQADHRLVIRGPYTWVRHPGYFGGWLGFAGFGLALSNWIALILLAVCTVPAFLFRIGVEEKALRDAFPEYADYARRVSKFVPLVW